MHPRAACQGDDSFLEDGVLDSMIQTGGEEVNEFDTIEDVNIISSTLSTINSEFIYIYICKGDRYLHIRTSQHPRVSVD